MNKLNVIYSGGESCFNPGKACDFMMTVKPDMQTPLKEHENIYVEAEVDTPYETLLGIFLEMAYGYGYTSANFNFI